MTRTSQKVTIVGRTYERTDDGWRNNSIPWLPMPPATADLIDRIAELETALRVAYCCDDVEGPEWVCKGGTLIDLFATPEAGAAMPCPLCNSETNR